MSEYQYYEFCSINKPLSKNAREEMRSLSSRANVGSHNASYVYNYGDFRGNPKKLVLKHFDVFFYISNFGTVQLLFKYPSEQIDAERLKQFAMDDIIEVEQHGEYTLLDIQINNEEGFGWTEGEGVLPELLPLHAEIQRGQYHGLLLVQAIHKVFCEDGSGAIQHVMKDPRPSEAAKTLLECVGMQH